MNTDGWEVPARIRVGDLDVDVGLQRVTRDGVALPLPKLSFDLLLALIHAAPNFVSNRQLLELVWPGLVVTDKTVSQRIKLLRDALGDSPDEPRYIVGLRSRGYRIVAPVSELPATERPPESAPRVGTIRDPEPSRRGLPWRTVAIAALAAILGFTLAPLLRSGPVLVPPAEVARAPTLVVLPFDQTPGSDADESVGRGIADAVRERLSIAPGLETIAPESSVLAVADGATSRQAAERLGARFVVDGTVEQDAKKLHIGVRLTDAGTGAELWTDHFARELDDIFDLQAHIAGQIADALSPFGVPPVGESPALRARSTEDVDAYLAYLRGRRLLERWTIVGAEQAEAEFLQAIERDPDFAAAYASLYDARLLAADRAGGAPSPAAASVYLGMPPLDEVRASNQPLIDRALALDPESGAAHFVRAIWAARDSDERQRDFERGLALDPGNGRGIVAYSEFLDRMQRSAEAESMLERALAIDPISPRANFRRVMQMYPVVPSEKLAGLADVLDVDPDYQPALQRYAKYVWMFNGDYALAIRTIEHALALEPGNPWLTHTAVAMYLDLGEIDYARELLAASDRPEISGDLLIAVHDRDLQTAGAAALEDTAFANGPYEDWGAYEALRDWAGANGQGEFAVESMLARSQLLDGPNQPSLRNFRAVPSVAQLLMTVGRDADARRLLMATIQWIDDVHLPNYSTVYALRVKATALMLLGEQTLALDALDASFRGHDFLQWWYTLERDPIWLPAHGDSRFIDIEARVRAQVDAQREALVILRAQGFVPAHVLGRE